MRRDVVKEGPLGIGVRMLAQTVEGMVDGGGGGVVSGLVRGRLDRRVIDVAPLGGEEVALVPPVQRAMETAVQHLAVDVPLAAVVAAIACRFQQVRQQPGPLRTNGDAAPAVTGQHVAPDLLGVIPGQEGRPGRPTASRVVKLGKTQPGRGQPIQVGRLDFASVTSQVRKPHVVRQDEDDVGRPDGRFLGAALSGSQDNQQERGDDEPVSHAHDPSIAAGRKPPMDRSGWCLLRRHARFPAPHAEVNVSPSSKRLGRSGWRSILGSWPSMMLAKDSPMGGPSLNPWPLPPKQA